MNDTNNRNKNLDLLISNLLLPDRFEGKQTILQFKVDILERIIEYWRFKNHYLENRLSFEDFQSSGFWVEDEAIKFKYGRSIFSNPGFKPIDYQAALLVFLLLNYKENLPIIQIIENFIHTIWDQLSFIDFKKTKTGVYRCFTNVRFAATTLREYGLLKYTRKEAYKTWTLSFPALLVAAKMIRNTDCFRIKEPDTKSIFGINNKIIVYKDLLGNFEECAGLLMGLCYPHQDIFPSFKQVIESTKKFVLEYWDVLTNKDINNTERREAGYKYMQKIENEVRLTNFYNDFSANLNVEYLKSKFSPD